MQRVTIVERHSGCPLYDYINVWKEDERNPSTPAKIIHLFSHIAKSLKEDQVTRVIFEPAVDSVNKPKKRHNYNYSSHRYGGGLGPSTHATTARQGTAGNPLMLAYRQPTLQSVRTRALEMWCCSSEHVSAALFVAPDEFLEDPQQSVQELTARFEDAYRGDLESLTDQFMVLAQDAEQARNDHSFLPMFSAFKLGLASEGRGDTSSQMTSPQPQRPTEPTQLLLSIDMDEVPESAPATPVAGLLGSRQSLLKSGGGDDDSDSDSAVHLALGGMLRERLEMGSATDEGDPELDDMVILATVRREKPSAGGSNGHSASTAAAAAALGRMGRSARAGSAVVLDEEPVGLEDVAIALREDMDEDDARRKDGSRGQGAGSSQGKANGSNSGLPPKMPPPRPPVQQGANR